MTTSHKYGCEHPGCHEAGTGQLVPGPFAGADIWRYLCAAHADEEEPTDELDDLDALRERLRTRWATLPLADYGWLTALDGVDAALAALEQVGWYSDERHRYHGTTTHEAISCFAFDEEGNPAHLEAVTHAENVRRGSHARR